MVPCGHVDFYPGHPGRKWNFFGSDDKYGYAQPGCSVYTPRYDLNDVAGCSHVRAYLLYLDTIKWPWACYASAYCQPQESFNYSCFKKREIYAKVKMGFGCKPTTDPGMYLVKYKENKFGYFASSDMVVSFVLSARLHHCLSKNSPGSSKLRHQ